MRVEWVHPSWRDLVIEELGRDTAARRRFLSHCGVDGAAVALSSGGGLGARRLPLLAADADWDALGDGLHRLTADLDDGDAARLLTVLAHTVEAEREPELNALTAMVLDRVARRRHAPCAVEALTAWLAAAAHLDPPPAPPAAVAATWVQLMPTEAPSTLADLEQLDEWLRLAEALARWAPEARQPLTRTDEALDGFVRSAPERFTREPERSLAASLLRRLPLIDPPLKGKALAAADALRALDAPDEEHTDVPEPPEAWLGAVDVDRVLRDLID